MRLILERRKLFLVCTLGVALLVGCSTLRKINHLVANADRTTTSIQKAVENADKRSEKLFDTCEKIGLTVLGILGIFSHKIEGWYINRKEEKKHKRRHENH